jgi:carbonic anhydrase
LVIFISYIYINEIVRRKVISKRTGQYSNLSVFNISKQFPSTRGVYRMSERGSFACVISCIDGRVQQPVTDWLTARLSVDYIDTITEAGPDKVLSSGSKTEVEALMRKVLISVNAHHSRAIAIVAHHDCAGNPVSKKEHVRFLNECVKVVESWGMPLRIITVYVNEEWAIELLTDTKK